MVFPKVEQRAAKRVVQKADQSAALTAVQMVAHLVGRSEHSTAENSADSMVGWRAASKAGHSADCWAAQ